MARYDIYDIAKKALQRKSENPFADNLALDLMLEIPKAVYGMKTENEQAKLFGQNEVANNFYVTAERLFQTNTNPDGTLSSHSMDTLENQMTTLRDQYVLEYPHAIEIIDSSLNHFSKILGRERENNVMYNSLSSNIEALYSEGGGFATLLDNYKDYTEAEILGKLGPEGNVLGKTHYFNELSTISLALDKYESQLYDTTRGFNKREGGSRIDELVKRGRLTLTAFQQQLLDVDEMDGTGKILTDSERQAIQSFVETGDSTLLNTMMVENNNKLQQMTIDNYATVEKYVGDYHALTELVDRYGNQEEIDKFLADPNNTEDPAMFTIAIGQVQDDQTNKLITVPTEQITVEEYYVRTKNALNNLKGVDEKLRALSVGNHGYMDVKGGSDIGLIIPRHSELAALFKGAEFKEPDIETTYQGEDVVPGGKKGIDIPPILNALVGVIRGDEDVLESIKEGVQGITGHTPDDKKEIIGATSYTVPDLGGGLTYDDGASTILNAGISNTEIPTVNNNYGTNLKPSLVDNKGIKEGEYANYGNLHILNSGSGNIVTSFLNYAEGANKPLSGNITKSIIDQFFRDNPNMGILQHGYGGHASGLEGSELNIKGELENILTNIYNFKHGKGGKKKNEDRVNEEIAKLESYTSYYDGSKAFYEGGAPENNSINAEWLEDGETKSQFTKNRYNYYDVYSQYPSNSSKESFVYALYHLPGESSTGKWVNMPPKDSTIREFLSQLNVDISDDLIKNVKKVWKLKYQLNIAIRDGKSEDIKSQLETQLKKSIGKLPSRFSVTAPGGGK